jgi:hypothetical protein
MVHNDSIQLKVRISREVSRRFKQYIINKYPDLLRGPLSEEVEKALIQYLESKDNTRTHMDMLQEKRQEQTQTTTIVANSTNNNTKYNRLIETIKRFSNSNKQISSGLAKKAIQQTIGKDQRTIEKYLKILQDDDILYYRGPLGFYDIQSWVFGDYRYDYENIKLTQ